MPSFAKTPSGEDIVILSLADYEAMMEALEDAADNKSVEAFQQARAQNPNLKLTPLAELEH